MTKEPKLAVAKWYHCATCLNFSFAPKRCCGKNMIEEGDEDAEEKENHGPYYFVTKVK